MSTSRGSKDGSRPRSDGRTTPQQRATVWDAGNSALPGGCRTLPTPFLDDGDVTLYQGDAAAVLATLPAGVVQTCVTSPPYWGLRDYGHGDQLGLEATPDLYVERLVAVFREVWRVLRDDGTVWLNLGDSYANDLKWGGASGGKHVMEGQTGGEGYRERRVTGLKPKDLVGIPWRVAFALQADGWYLRSDIIWAKPNPMPESVTDRPTKAHEYLFLLAKRPRYFYDADAIREPAAIVADGRDHDRPTDRVYAPERNDGDRVTSIGYGVDPAGRNRRSVWTIATEPFPEAHFATYPQELVRPCILAGTSERGECSACGAPWQRIVEQHRNGRDWNANNRRGGDRMVVGQSASESLPDDYRAPTTLGWRPSCQCAAPTRPQTVLDPFCGSGTTALVARKHGRRCIGIDLAEPYLEIAKRRTQQLSLLA